MKQLEITRIARSGFRSETEVRDALFELYDYIFEEFFKISGAILVLSALFAAHRITNHTAILAIYFIGVLLLTLKILTYSSHIKRCSIYDDIDNPKLEISRWRRRIWTWSEMISGVVIMHLIQIGVSSLVEILVETPAAA